MKFKPKPSVIEAVQWTGDNLEEVLKFVDKAIGITEDDESQNIFIHVLGGAIYVAIGDWVVRRLNGNYHVYGSDIFEEIYEPVD